MPWCPYCKEEYVEGISQCPECGEDLMNSLPENTLGPEQTRETMARTHVEEKLLCVAENEVDYAVITDALNKEGISFITRERGIWDYFHILSGHSFLGQEIYVAGRDFARAAEIVDYFRELKDDDKE